MAELIEIEGIGAAVASKARAARKRVIVPKDKTVNCRKACKLTVPKGAILTSPKGTIYAADKKTTVKVAAGTKVKVPSTVSKTFSPEEAAYGAQEYERWTGKKIAPEEYAKAIKRKVVPEGEEVPEEEGLPPEELTREEAREAAKEALVKKGVPPAAAAAAVKFFEVTMKTPWMQAMLPLLNKVAGAARDAAVKVTSVKVARAEAQRLWNLLQSMAPRITDARWKANYATIAAEYAKLERETAAKLDGYNEKMKQVKEDLEEAKTTGKLEGLGAFHLPLIAWVAIFATLSYFFFRKATEWRALAVKEQQALNEGQLLLGQTALVQTELEKTKAARDELAKLDADYATEEKRYQETKDPAIAEQMNVKREKRDVLVDVITRETPVLPSPSAPAEEAKVPEEEKSMLEKFIGIKPGAIVAVIIVGLLIMAAPRIAETMKTITKKD